MPLMKKPYAYSRVDKEDPEDVFHRRARFLIYKTLEEADSVSRRPRRRRLPTFLRSKLSGLNVNKIGKSLKKLQRSLALAVTFGVNKHFLGGFNAWKRMFRCGAATGLPPPIFSLEV